MVQVVDISLLYLVDLMSHVFLHLHSRHLKFIISSDIDGTFEKINYEYMGVAVGMVFLACLEAETHWRGNTTPTSVTNVYV
jgi:hypothetical protein